MRTERFLCGLIVGIGLLVGSPAVFAQPLFLNISSILAVATSVTATTIQPISSPIQTPTTSSTPKIQTLHLKEYPNLTIELAGRVISVSEVTAVQALQILQWEKENEDAKTRRTLSWMGFFAGILILVFTGLRAISHHRQVQEQMLSSYRERLFSKDPAAVIAASMSLSNYPREAIWLVMRWAQEHKKQELLQIEDSYQVKQAIQDALDNMSRQKTWGFIWKSSKKNWLLCLPKWFKLPQFRIQGARLDGKTITIDIGPIHLYNVFMSRGHYENIGLKRAKLLLSNMENAILCKAHLERTNLSLAHLERANLQYAHLENAFVAGANLEKANLECAHLEMANLRGVCLHSAYLTDSHLEGTDLYKANLTNAKLEDDFLSYAQEQEAILDEGQKQRVQEWNKKYPDAPWLKSGWKSWWQHEDEKEKNKIREEEIRIVREYIDQVRKEEQKKS